MTMWKNVFLSGFVSLNACALLAEEEKAAEIVSYQVVEDEVTLPILTPALEGRSTEKLILNNGLKVYLVSDPGADQSAAAVTVSAGSWEDPKEYPGTAHFLEHMLFLGTKAYPNEEEFMPFIHEHGGKVNAFTATDRTVYMFSSNNEAFEDSLDRFSHFFIDPLLSTNCINRELHAVDQEHAKNIEQDGWRQWMIMKESSNPNHPHSAFSTGNAQTLSGIPQSVLRNWYQTHYSADQMHLVMISPLSLEDMRILAVGNFSSVPKVSVTKTPIPSEISSAKQRGHMIFIKPVKDLKQLSLAWEVKAPFAQDLSRSAPFLVAYALGQEGKQSLTQTLKDEKLAENVQIGCDRLSKDSLFFSIDISLTDSGLKQVDAIISRAFEAISRLKKEGYPSYLFNEIQTISKLNYQFQSRDDAFDAIMSMASEIPYEKFASYPQKTRVPTQYDPTFIHSFVETLKAENCIYLVLADPAKTKIPTDIKEKWMQAEYTIKPVAKVRMTMWNELDPNPAIQLPHQNPYLPTQLELLSSDETDARPTLITSDEGCCIYYAQDTYYKVPEVSLLFHFKSPLIENTAVSSVFCDLYVRALTETLSSSLALASDAGLSLDFCPENLGLQLSLNGYNDKAPRLLSEVFSTLPKVTITQEQFEIYRSSLTSLYDNFSKELPVVQAMQQLNCVLFNSPTVLNKLSVIKTLSYEQFQQFATHVFEKTYTEAFFYGNLSQEDAKELWADLNTSLASTPFPKNQHPQKKILVLDGKGSPRKLVQSTDRQGYGAILLLQEGPFNFENRAIQQVLGSALSDDFFDTLRTKQQTAYMAKASNTERERQLLQFFAVQSSTHTPTDLLARFELFLENFDKNLNTQISEGRFESIRSNLITLLKMPPENMPGMTSRLDQLAFEYHDFGWINKRIDSLKTLSYENFCQTAHQFLARTNSKRLAILMEGVVPKENDFHYEIVSKEELIDKGTFSSAP